MKKTALLFAALLLAGCPGITRPLEKPTASFRGMSSASVGLSGLSATAGFSIQNPNSVGLPLRAVDWELSIGGSAPVRGRVELSETIPAKGSAPIDVNIKVSPGAAIGIGRRISSGNKNYEIRGVLHFQTRFGDIAVGFDHNGSLGDL